MRLSMLINEEIGSEKLEFFARKYRDNDFLRAELTKDKAKRFCFDVFNFVIRTRPGLLDDLYSYLNDDHIYSYLKNRLSYELSIVNS